MSKFNAVGIKTKEGGNIVVDKGSSAYKDAIGAGGIESIEAKGARETELKSLNKKPSSSLASKPSIINTSSLSKSNYTENVNSMNVANENLRTVQQGQTASGIAASLGMTPEKFLELNPGFGAPGAGGTKGDYIGLDGTIKPGMTYKVGPDGSSQVVEEAPKPDANGNIVTQNDDGTTQTTDSAGQTTITNTNGVSIDPTIKKLLDDNIVELTTASVNAKEIMDRAAATLMDNPATQVAANDIKRKYDVLIEQMKEKNKMLLGGIGKNAARTGMLQYANEMDSNFKSMELDKSVMRIADLVERENSEIAKSNAAFKSGDVKAFDTASKEYTAALKEKQNAIMDLNKALTDAVKANEAEIKRIKSEEKQAITDDIRVSAALGRTMVDAIINSGVKDEAQIDKYIKAMAEANGINNPNILKSAFIKEQEARDSLNLKNKNTVSIINKRNTTGNGKGKPKKITIGDGLKIVGPQLEGVKGDDGFIDPDNWLKARTKWVNDAGLSTASFNSNFKKYLNPLSYPKAGFKLEY